MRRHRFGAALVTGAAVIASLVSTASPALAYRPPSAMIVDANGGVYWRSEPSQNSQIVRPGFGVYTGDHVILQCYRWGDGGPVGNHLWYYASNLSRNQHPDGNPDSGYVNDHYLNTPGTAANPQPQGFPCG